MSENINGKAIIILDENLNEKHYYKIWNNWNNPYYVTIYNPVNNTLIDSRYMSNKIESVKRCYRCLDLQEKNRGLKRDLNERKDHYKANVCTGVNNKALIAKKTVIKDIEFRITKN